MEFANAAEPREAAMPFKFNPDRMSKPIPVMRLNTLFPNVSAEKILASCHRSSLRKLRIFSLKFFIAPLGAVQRTGEVGRVFVVRDGIARERIVALGEADDRRVEIRTGLTGKEILVANPAAVHDGDKVNL